MFERLKARLERFLAEHSAGADPRARAAALQAAVIEGKVGVGNMRQGVERTERELANERQLLTDAERRGEQAAQIQDEETARVAGDFIARHRERIGVLERKLAAQRDELALAERDLATMTAELRRARQGLGAQDAGSEAAWRDIESAGGTRPATDVNDELLRHQLDQERQRQAIDAQLAHLKKKLGRDQ